MLYFKWILTSLLISTQAFASQLPKLKTKQDLNNLRYISADGKTSYFQNRSGKLSLSALFKNESLIDYKKYTHFLVHVSNAKKLITIEADTSYNTNFDLTKNNDLYLSRFAQKEVKPMGKGKNPTLHLEDQFVSFYNAKDKIIKLLNTSNMKLVKEIKLTNSINPFFTPQMLMLNAETFLYTDINKDGQQALISITLNSDQATPLFKGKTPGTKIEICQFQDKILVGEFSYPSINRGSSIAHLVFDENKANLKTIYSSSLNDLGQLTCVANDGVYFIKTFFEDRLINYNKTDVVKLDIKTGQIEIKSDLLKTTQIIEMDQRLLIPAKGELFVVTGETNLNLDKLMSDKDFSFIKAKDEFNEMYKPKPKRKKPAKKRRPKKKKKQ